MKFVLLSLLATSSAMAFVPTRVILKCQSPSEDRTLKIEELPQAYAISMTDLSEKRPIGTSYVYKTQNIEVTPTRFAVYNINGTSESYSISVDSFAILQGESPVGLGAKGKVFETLMPGARKFKEKLLRCSP